MRLPAALALLLLASPVSAKPASPTIVTIADGTLRGDQVEGIVSFKGIPFAKPPVGPLRWRAPQPASRWNGERDATRYSHDCMQKPFNGDAAPLGTPPAEDCLYANVWKPAGAAEKLPVMVWIYGGGFLNGGASPAVYSGAPLARQGIMVVSFNYRLGRLGTFAHPQLTKADPDRGQLANYGYMDQVAALRWIKRNIAAFGGDPGNITIVGESAGGMSAHTLVTSPQTRGLFQRAVMLSGGPHEAATFASAEATGLAFAQSKGIAPDDPQALDRLRALSAADVAGDINMIALFSPPRGPKTFSSPGDRRQDRRRPR